MINYPSRGIGTTTVERLVLYSQARHCSLWDALRTSEAAGVHGPARTAIGGFVSVIERLAAAFESGVDVVGATRGLLDDIKLYDDLRAAAPSMSAAQRRIDNVEGLIASLGR